MLLHVMCGWYMYGGVVYVSRYLHAVRMVLACCVLCVGGVHTFSVLCVWYLYIVFDELALKQTHINNGVNAYPEHG